MTEPTKDRALLQAIACRLRWHIRRSGHSVNSFARLACIPHSTLHDYLKGQRKISVNSVEKLAKSGIDIDWLLTGRRPSRAPETFSPVYRAVSAVMDDPVDYSDAEIEFAICSAHRLGRFGAGALFVPAQLDIVARINARAAELAGH